MFQYLGQSSSRKVTVFRVMGQTVEQAAVETYKSISDFVNAYRMNGDLIAKELKRDHNYLQWCVIRLFLDCIKGMAEMDADRITIQNRDTVELCKRITALEA